MESLLTQQQRAKMRHFCYRDKSQGKLRTR